MIAMLMGTLAVAGCAGGNSPSTAQKPTSTVGLVEIGNYSVGWFNSPEMRGAPQDGLTPLVFIYAFKLEDSNLTDADWKKLAEENSTVTTRMKQLYGTKGVFYPEQVRHTMSVKEFKKWNGDKYYKTKDGQIKQREHCSIGMAEAGICGKKLDLSLQQRAKMAEKILAASGKCKWVKFDPAYNRIYNMAVPYGPEGTMLAVRADCAHAQ